VFVEAVVFAPSVDYFISSMLTRAFRSSSSFDSDSLLGGTNNADEPGSPSSSTPPHEFHFVRGQDADEDWGVVSEDGTRVGSEADLHNGVLIVSGSEGSYEGHNDINNVSSGTEAEDLSLPGTESLPTDLDSLDGMGDEKHAPSDYSFSSHGAVREHLKELTLANVLKREFWVTKNNHPTKNLRLTVKGLAVLLVILFLMWDRYSLQATKSRLEQELRLLQQEQADTYGDGQNLTAYFLDNMPDVYVPSYDPQNQEKIYDGSDHHDGKHDEWYHGDEYTDFEDILFADNCWVKAKMSVSFGNCANEAKETFKEWSTSIYDSVGFFGHKFKDKFTTFTHQAWDHNPFEGGIPFQKAGLSLDVVTEATSAVASTAVAVSDAVGKAVAVVDDSILQFLDVARDAIDDATSTVRLDESHH
jgi:hypothetical protein